MQQPMQYAQQVQPLQYAQQVQPLQYAQQVQPLQYAPQPLQYAQPGQQLQYAFQPAQPQQAQPVKQELPPAPPGFKYMPLPAGVQLPLGYTIPAGTPPGYYPVPEEKKKKARKVHTKDSVGSQLAVLKAYTEAALNAARHNKTGGVREWIHVNSELKKLETAVRNVFTTLKTKSTKPRKPNPNNAFTKPVPITDKLADFLNLPHGHLIARGEVTKAMVAYVKANNLQMVGNGRVILPDAKLAALLDYTPEKGELNFFSIQTLLSPLYVKDPAKEKIKLEKKEKAEAEAASENARLQAELAQATAQFQQLQLHQQQQAQYQAYIASQPQQQAQPQAQPQVQQPAHT